MTWKQSLFILFILILGGVLVFGRTYCPWMQANLGVAPPAVQEDKKCCEAPKEIKSLNHISPAKVIEMADAQKVRRAKVEKQAMIDEAYVSLTYAARRGEKGTTLLLAVLDKKNLDNLKEVLENDGYKVECTPAHTSGHFYVQITCKEE